MSVIFADTLMRAAGPPGPDWTPDGAEWQVSPTGLLFPKKTAPRYCPTAATMPSPDYQVIAEVQPTVTANTAAIGVLGRYISTSDHYRLLLAFTTPGAGWELVLLRPTIELARHAVSVGAEPPIVRLKLHMLATAITMAYSLDAGATWLGNWTYQDTYAPVAGKAGLRVTNADSRFSMFSVETVSL